MTMTGSSNEAQHEGSILFGLPDGSALFYGLIGQAGEPLPEAELTFDVKARSKFEFSVTIRNWTKASQHLRLDAQVLEELEPGIPTTLEGPPLTDIPGLVVRDIQLVFLAHKPGMYKCLARFINDHTKEFLFFKLAFTAHEADTVVQIPFTMVTRELRIHTLHFRNPLQTVVSFAAKCEDPEVCSLTSFA
jgi:hypothetical protein